MSVTGHPATIAPSAPASYDAASVAYRELTSIEDFQACVALQHATWGEDGETVAASLLCGATHVGGLVLGAFAPDGTLVGFVFGLAGVEGDEVVHWSHMLAVREAARGAGIGRTLKERQRAELARRHVARIYWTFDPLQARNAHLNINRLGARVSEYVENMYGVTRSPLHLGMATDRLIAVLDPAGRPPADQPPDAEPLPVFTPEPRAGDLVATGTPAVALIEIPWDIQQVLATSREVAARWREAVRAHFRLAFAHGYMVTRVHRDPVARRAFYRIARAGAGVP